MHQIVQSYMLIESPGKYSISIFRTWEICWEKGELWYFCWGKNACFFCDWRMVIWNICHGNHLGTYSDISTTALILPVFGNQKNGRFPSHGKFYCRCTGFLLDGFWIVFHIFIPSFSWVIYELKRFICFMVWKIGIVRPCFWKIKPQDFQWTRRGIPSHGLLEGITPNVGKTIGSTSPKFTLWLWLT